MMNEKRRSCLDNDECATKTPMLPKYDQLGTSVQHQQSCHSSKSKCNFKSHWRRFVSNLPSWARNILPDSVRGSDTAATSKTGPPVACASNVSGYQLFEQGLEKIRRSCERIYSNLNFQNVISDQNTLCELCKQKGWSVCGKHSVTTEPINKKNKNAVQIGVAEVPSGNKQKTECRCSKTKTLKGPIKLNSYNCNTCKRKPSITHSGCKQSLLDQARAYLQKITSDHKRDCPRCIQKQSSNTSKQLPTSQAYSGKETILNQAWGYLQKLVSDENLKCCQRCTDQGKSVCCKHTTFSEVDTSYQRSKDQSKPISCDHSSDAEYGESCCQRCKELGLPVCCIHAPAAESDNNCCQTCTESGQPVCCKHSTIKEVVQGSIKKSSTHTTCECSGKDSLELYAEEHMCPADDTDRDFKSCPKLCIKTSSQELAQPVKRCKSAENEPYNVSCCKKSSQSPKLIILGSNQGSCCSYHSVVIPKMSNACVGQCKQPLPLEDNYDPPCCTLPCEKCSSQNEENQESQECLEGQEDQEDQKDLDCPECQAAQDGQDPGQECPECPEDQEGQDQGQECQDAIKKSDSRGPKQGISLTMEPNDHKFCTKPNCKHTKASTESMESPKACEDSPPSTCEGSVNQEVAAPMPSCTPCVGGCIKCNSQYATSTPKYQENRMVDAKYEAFLDERFGRMVASQLQDKETICKPDCSCVSCIGNITPPKPEPTADPYKYRYYY